MKKFYTAPEVDITLFTLQSSIATAATSGPDIDNPDNEF